MLYLWDAGRRHSKTYNPWTDTVGIFGFRPILGAWVGSGRFCSHLGPGTPNTPWHLSPTTLAWNAKPGVQNLVPWIQSWEPLRSTSVSREKWCSGHGCLGQADAEENRQSIIHKQKKAMNYKCIFSVIKWSLFLKYFVIQIFQDVLLNLQCPFTFAPQ